MSDLITATVRPTDNPGTWDGDALAFHYRVTLRYQGRRMTIPFHTGSGWTREPNARDVLEALLSDAGTVDNAESFEDWCGELGFDPDSRKAERIYNASVRQTDALKRLLGDDYEDAVFGENQEATATRLTGLEPRGAH